MLKYPSCRLGRTAALIAVGIGLLSLVRGIASAAGEDSIPPAAQAAERQEAAQIYRARCAKCHGETAEGVGDAKTLATPDRYGMLRRGAHYEFRHDDSSHPHGTVDAPTADQLAAIEGYIRSVLATPLPDGSIERGAKIFQRTCSVCHGDRGNGASWTRTTLNPPPFDFTSAKAQTLSRLHMVNTVSHGSPNTAMMGFTTQLSRRDIVDVVDYIRSTFIFASRSANLAGPEHAGHAESPADMSAALPNGLSGDRERGSDLFRANCIACHGETGNGSGPRAYFMFRKPADFHSASARETLNRPHLFASISGGVTGSEMPAWSKVLTDQQIADLAEYVLTEFIFPQPSAERTGGPNTAEQPNLVNPSASPETTGNDAAPAGHAPDVKKK